MEQGDENHDARPERSSKGHVHEYEAPRKLGLPLELAHCALRNGEGGDDQADPE